MVVAINQPCYLPWRGHFALMKTADVFVFYDDVQFTSDGRTLIYTEQSGSRPTEIYRATFNEITRNAVRSRCRAEEAATSVAMNAGLNG